MQKRKFTVVTQLHEKNNRDIIEYVESSRREYAKAVRETFYAIRSGDFNKAQHSPYLQHKHGVVKRTAGSIILDAQGRLNALRELKKYERKQLESKITHLENVIIPKLVEQRNRNSRILNMGGFVSLVKQQNLRLKIVAKKARLNQLKQKLNNLGYQLDSGRLKLCFGTKRLMKRNHETFVEQRDGQMVFIGAKYDTACNQNLQLMYNKQNNQFRVRLRKDFGGYKPAKGTDRYVCGQVYFRHNKEHLVSILESKYSPLSYRIINKNGRYYLYCTFEIHVSDKDYITHSHQGVIGLDFNKGFITLSETNQYGHLIRAQRLSYHFKSGNKTKTGLQNIANHIIRLACQTGKDICVENLDFKTRKSKTETRQGKKYNEMIHSLAYRQFSDIIESITYRNKVNLIKVNPAWTSWLAERIYCPTMKLNIHVGASYVIARRGQGYKDTVK